MSPYTLHVSHIMCHMSFKNKCFFDQVVKLVGGGSVINEFYPIYFDKIPKSYIFYVWVYILEKVSKFNVCRIQRGCSRYDSGQNATEPKHKHSNLNISYKIFFFLQNNYNLLDRIRSIIYISKDLM